MFINRIDQNDGTKKTNSNEEETKNDNNSIHPEGAAQPSGVIVDDPDDPDAVKVRSIQERLRQSRNRGIR
jgi:hypothetical protein